MENKQGISVIIVAYNVRDILSSCLESVLHSGAQFDGDFEILVVDNNSRDGTVDVLRPRFREVSWITSEKNIGFGSGCNRGAASSNYSLLLFLNPDTIVEESTLQVMWDLWRKYEDIGVAGCRIMNSDNTLQLACRRSFPTPRVAGYRLLGLSRLFPKSKRYGQYNLTFLDEHVIQEVDAVSGSFLCVERAVFDDIGGFDEDFFMYGEDLDLCYRAKLKGRKNFYTPETTVMHFKGESAKTRPVRSLFHFYRAMIVFSRKHFELRTLPLFLFYTGITGLAVIDFIHRRWNKWMRWTLDLVLVNGTLGLITVLYSAYRDFPHVFYTNAPLYFTWHGILSFLVVGILGYRGDYGKIVQNLKQSSISAALAILAFFAVGYFFYEGAFSRIVFGLSGIVGFFCLTGWRALAAKGSIFFGKIMSAQKRTVIIGTNSRGVRLKELMLAGHPPGHEFIGFIPGPNHEIPPDMRSDQICDFEKAPIVLKELEVHEIVITLDEEAYQTALQVFSRMSTFHPTVKILVGDPKIGSISLVDLNYNG